MKFKPWIPILVCLVCLACLAIVVLLAIAFVGIDRVAFPPTFVINLDDRTDRLAEIRTEFRNWPVPVERISAIRQSPGWKGCSASHLKCIRIAKERNYPWVLILEDDCILTPNASRRLHDMLAFLWTNRSRWDIFNGGVTYVKRHNRVAQNPSIHEVYGYAANLYIVHRAVYDRILNGHPTHPNDFQHPIDVYYADTLRIWTTTPYLSKQRPGASDIVGDKKVEDYTHLFDDAEAMLTDS